MLLAGRIYEANIFQSRWRGEYMRQIYSNLVGGRIYGGSGKCTGCAAAPAQGGHRDKDVTLQSFKRNQEVILFLLSYLTRYMCVPNTFQHGSNGAGRTQGEKIQITICQLFPKPQLLILTISLPPNCPFMTLSNESASKILQFWI